MPPILVPLEIPPGVLRNGTPLQSKPRWRDSHLVRWREGALEPQGGWVQRTKDDEPLKVEGAARAAFAWRDNSGSSWLAIGTHTGLYAFQNAIERQDITPSGYVAGSAGAILRDGYGMGDYGEGDYGMDGGKVGHTDHPTRISPGDDQSYLPATSWTLDNWGENLLAHASHDGVIYEWPLAGAAVPLANAPTNNASYVVTNERIVMAIGAGGNPRLVKWSDQENNTQWTPDPLNQAGDLELHTNGALIAARAVPDGTLIWSTEDVWLARYLGQPLIYGFTALAGKCSLVSAQAIAGIDNRVMWMGNNGFWLYDGYLQALPSDVTDDIFSHINRTQISKTWALTNHDMHEVVWFYASDISEEIDSYVTYNYKDGYWIVGRIERLCGVPAGIFSNPILIDAEGQLWNHGVGYEYPGAELPFAQSWPIEIGNGERAMFIRKLIPDEIALGDVEVSFQTRQYPTGPEINHGPYQLKNPTNMRLANKQVAVRFTGKRPVQWRVGRMRLEVVAQGQR